MLILGAAIGLLILPSFSVADDVRAWELVNPEGGVTVKPLKLADRITSLEGKRVVLRWNGKPNGEILLERVAELLIERVRDIKLLKAYQSAPETSIITHDMKRAQGVAKKLLSFKPDLVISAQAD